MWLIACQLFTSNVSNLSVTCIILANNILYGLVDFTNPCVWFALTRKAPEKKLLEASSKSFPSSVGIVSDHQHRGIHSGRIMCTQQPSTFQRLLYLVIRSDEVILGRGAEAFALSCYFGRRQKFTRNSK